MRTLLALFTIGLVSTVGCGPVESDITTLLSAGAKLASNPADPPIGEITAKEWVVLSKNLPELAANFPQLGLDPAMLAAIPALTAEQAQAIVDFLAQYEIATVADLQDLLARVGRGEIELEIPEVLLELIESLGFETDAAKLAPLE